jgi:hypothetical protein
VSRYIGGAEELLDQAIGVRKEADALNEKRERERAKGPAPRAEPAPKASVGPLLRLTTIEIPALDAVARTSGWDDAFRSWAERTRKTMRAYLLDGYETALPVVRAGPPRRSYVRSKREWRGDTFDDRERWLKRALRELKQLQSALGVSRDVARISPPPGRFEELHASGLVGKRVVRDHARAMRAPRTPKQLKDAIGSAKELTEATLRAALDQLAETYQESDDLPRLMRKWRTAVGKQAPPDPKGHGSLDNAQAALANLVTFLAEWRNKYGSGHGRKDYPPGLAARHARLAADAAETCIRFIVTTMDDLELLPS